MSAPTKAQWTQLMEGVNERAASRTAIETAFNTARGADLSASDVGARTASLDAARELGSNHDVARYITKLKAMTNPTGYARINSLTSRRSRRP